MDWTGGTRRRYAPNGKNNEILAKQKAHFAKARASGATHTPGSMPDFIREAVGHKISSVSARSRHSAHASDRGGSRSSTSAGHGRGHSNVVSRPRDDAAQHSAPTTRDSSFHALPPRSRRVETSTNPARITDGETRLRLNRQRLLARTDWLGLVASRPLKIDFPSVRDKERVGKRRKIDKTRRNDTNKSLPRRITPPFQHRERLVEPMMSGAIMSDNIKVKIGTDALASQTQQSRRTVTSINTSMRPPSTDFGPLSEESMLLGEEDHDIFTGYEPLGTGHCSDAIERVPRVRTAYSAHLEVPFSTGWFIATSDSQEWPSAQTGEADRQTGLSPYVPVAPVLQHDAGELRRDHAQQCIANTFDRRTESPDVQLPRSIQLHDSPFTQSATDAHHVANMAPLAAAALDDDDDGELELRQQRLSNNSELCNKVSMPALHTIDHLLTENAPSTRSLAIHERQPLLGLGLLPMDSWATSVPQLSNTEVRAAITDTTVASKSAMHKHRADDQNSDSDITGTHDNDDEKWTQFIFGSRELEVGSSFYNDTTRAATEQSQEPAVTYLTNASSDQPRSDRVTIGRSTAAAYPSTDEATTALAEDPVENTSLIGHAATAVDDIEDDHSPKVRLEVKRQKLGPSRALNPARFKRRKRSYTEPLRKPDRFLPSTSVCAVTHGRSVYDLSSNGDYG